MSSEKWVWDQPYENVAGGPYEKDEHGQAYREMISDVREDWAVQILFNDAFETQIKYVLEEIEKKLHEIGCTKWTYVAGRIGEADSGE